MRVQWPLDLEQHVRPLLGQAHDRERVCNHARPRRGPLSRAKSGAISVRCVNRAERGMWTKLSVRRKFAPFESIERGPGRSGHLFLAFPWRTKLE